MVDPFSSPLSVLEPSALSLYKHEKESLGTLSSDDARDEGDPFKPKNLFFLILPLSLPDTNAVGAYSLPLFSLRLLSQPLPFLLLSQLLCHMLVSPSLDIILMDFLLWLVLLRLKIFNQLCTTMNTLK